jgi:hypothetical protein
MGYQLPSCFAPKKQGLSDSARNCRVQFTTERIISAQAQAVRYLAPAVSESANDDRRRGADGFRLDHLISR